MQNKALRFEALTGARFIAAAHVLVFHYAAPLFASLPAWLERIRAHGFIAVSFFFVLSGFILAVNYADKAVSGALDRSTFWLSRFARIYPTYLFGLLLLVPLSSNWLDAPMFAGVSEKAKVVTAAAHASMSQAWVPQLVGSWNVPGWSLSVEAFFYAVFPFVVLAFARASLRSLVGAAAVAYLVALAIPIGYLIASPDGLTHATDASRGFWLTLVKFSPLVRLPEFIFGVCLGVAFKRLSARGESRWDLVLAPAAAAGVGLVLIAAEHLPYVLLHNGLLMPLFGALIVGLARGRCALSRILSTRPLIKLGEGSYALYILQWPLWTWAALLAGPALVQTTGFAAAFLVGMVAASLASYRWIEVPAQRLLLSAFAARKAAPDARGSAAASLNLERV